MRINQSGNELNGLSPKPLDPNVLLLIQKLSGQPLAIKSTLAIENALILQLLPLQTNLSGLTQLSQITLSDSKAVALLTQQQSNGQLKIKLELRADKAGVSLKVVDSKVPASVLLKREYGSGFLSLNDAHLHLSNSPLKRPMTVEPNANLTQKPVQSPSPMQALTGGPLSEIAKLATEILKHANAGEAGKPVASQLTQIGKDFQTLVNATLKPLAQIAGISPENKVFQQLLTRLAGNTQPGPWQKIIDTMKLFADINSLTLAARPPTSADAKARIEQSGAFLEAKLRQGVKASQNNALQESVSTRKTRLNRLLERAFSSSTNAENALPKRNNSAESGVGRTSNSSSRPDGTQQGGQNLDIKDLKSTFLQLRQTLVQLSQLLSKNDAQPLAVKELLQALKAFANSQGLSTPQSQGSQTSSSVPPAESSRPTLPAPQSQVSLSHNELNLLRKMLAFEAQFAGRADPMKSKQTVNELLDIQRAQINAILKSTANLINRLETNQLLSLRSEQPMLQQFLVDLPILKNGHLDSFELLIDRKAESADKNARKTWQITVKFDLEPLGPMFARVALKNQRLSTHIFAEQESTAQLIKAHLSTLRKSLFAAGVDVEEVTGQQGIVPDKLIPEPDSNLDLHV